jgi:hypothetical protein
VPRLLCHRCIGGEQPLRFARESSTTCACAYTYTRNPVKVFQKGASEALPCDRGSGCCGRRCASTRTRRPTPTLFSLSTFGQGLSHQGAVTETGICLDLVEEFMDLPLRVCRTNAVGRLIRRPKGVNACRKHTGIATPEVSMSYRMSNTIRC